MSALPAEPRKKLAVVACMDARLNPAEVLGLEEGDAHVIRNAGGVVTDDVRRSLLLSQHLLGTTEIVLIHHTKCGVEGLNEPRVMGDVEQKVGERPSYPLGGFEDAEQDVRDSITTLREDPFLQATTSIVGCIYDVDTRELREVARS